MRFLSISFLALTLAGCSLLGGDSEVDVIRGIGTIEFVELEGGFYGIIDDDGSRYDPVDLPAEHQVEGRRVRYRLRPADDQLSFHMWAMLVNVVEIEGVDG